MNKIKRSIISILTCTMVIGSSFMVDASSIPRGLYNCSKCKKSLVQMGPITYYCPTCGYSVRY